MSSLKSRLHQGSVAKRYIDHIGMRLDILRRPQQYGLTGSAERTKTIIIIINEFSTLYTVRIHWRQSDFDTFEFVTGERVERVEFDFVASVHWALDSTEMSMLRRTYGFYKRR